MKTTDLTIIGAGPVGLFAGFYAQLRELDVTTVESLATVGGQITALYPYKKILDVAGFPKIFGQNLIDQLQAQFEQFKQTVRVETTVTGIEQTDEGFLIQTEGEQWLSKTVLLATGRGAFEPRVLPDGIVDATASQRVHYLVTNPEQYRQRKVLIAGGGDTALDWALMLHDAGAQVTLTHRRDNFRALESAVTAVKDSDIKLLMPYSLQNIQVTGDGVQVTFKRSGANEQLVEQFDDVIVAYGFTAGKQTVEDWNLPFEMERQKIVVDQQLATAVPGIFAVGDIAGYPGKAELIATGFGEVPTAVNAIMQYLHPAENVVPLHSSSLAIVDGKIKWRNVNGYKL